MTNNSTEQRTENKTPQPRTRREAKNKEHADNRVERKWISSSLFSISLRIVIVIVLLVIAAFAGSAIGYGAMGDGNPLDVLNPATWQHVFDILNGKQS